MAAMGKKLNPPCSPKQSPPLPLHESCWANANRKPKLGFKEKSPLSYIPRDEDEIVIPTEDLAEGNALWENVLVGVAVKRKIFYRTLVDDNTKSWNCHAGVIVVALENYFFLLNFDSDVDCKIFEGKGLVMVKGTPLLLKRWHPQLKFHMEVISCIMAGPHE